MENDKIIENIKNDCGCGCGPTGRCEAHRLEGKVKNKAIKNVKKPKKEKVD